MATLLASTHDGQMLAATPAELQQAQEVVDLLDTPANHRLGLTTSHHQDLVAVPENRPRSWPGSCGSSPRAEPSPLVRCPRS